jgi:hypothetical protein
VEVVEFTSPEIDGEGLERVDGLSIVGKENLVPGEPAREVHQVRDVLSPCLQRLLPWQVEEGGVALSDVETEQSASHAFSDA